MISEDGDLRRWQVLGLVLIVASMVTAVLAGVFLAAYEDGHHVGTVAAWLGGATFVVGEAGAIAWGLACKRDMKRHPNGNVARNRLRLGGAPPSL